MVISGSSVAQAVAGEVLPTSLETQTPVSAGIRSGQGDQEEHEEVQPTLLSGRQDEGL